MLIFPICTFLFLVLGVYRRFASRLNLREAFLIAVVVWGMIIVLLNETLSIYQSLSFPYLSVSWILLTWLGLLFCTCLPADQHANLQVLNLKKKVFLAIHNLTLLDIVLLTLISLILFLVALTAVMAPPNNWDSLVYHMARVPHWIANQTIVHYPTNIKTQIYYSPFAEWVILQLQILLGSDRLANCVQWFAMFGSGVTATLLAKLFGLRRTGQLFAALLSVSIPMGIVQGSSTQNDYVLGFWLMVFVYFSLKVIVSGKTLDAFGVGGALGLAFLTKASAGIFALPFLVWLLIGGIKNHGLKILGSAMIVVVLVSTINMNHARRNYDLSKHVFGESEVFGITRNERMDLRLFASNALRNIGLHLATSIKPLNKMTEKGIEDFHRLLHINSVEPATTLGVTPLQISVSTHEDVAGNFFQLLLIVFVMAVFLSRRKIWAAKLWQYVLALCGVFILYNLLLKWQPAGSRLHLPLFLLWMPLVAAVFFSFQKRRNLIIGIVVALLLSTSVPYVLRNSTRKLFSSKKTVFSIPRLQQYFAADLTILPHYQGAVDFVRARDCDQVGLRLGDNSWEYPLEVLFKNKHQGKVRLEHVDIIGIKPLNYPLGDFHPCAIIETGRTVPVDDKLNIDGRSFVKQYESSLIRVYAIEK